MATKGLWLLAIYYAAKSAGGSPLCLEVELRTFQQLTPLPATGFLSAGLTMWGVPSHSSEGLLCS